MKTAFELVADPRDGVQGKGASRRLRRSGKVPAILYGGHSEPRQIILDHQNLLSLLVNERFFSTILALKIKDEMQPAIVKDVQRHPAKNQILHMDLQRVLENEPVRMMIPLHFKGGAAATSRSSRSIIRAPRKWKPRQPKLLPQPRPRRLPPVLLLRPLPERLLQPARPRRKRARLPLRRRRNAARNDAAAFSGICR